MIRPGTAAPPDPYPRSVWPALSLVIGGVALALAFVPHAVGLIAVAAGGFGVAAGTLGVLLRGQRRAVWPLSGIAVSTLAVVVAAALTFGQLASGGREDGETRDTATVLSKEVAIAIGAFSYHPPPPSAVVSPSLEGATLPVTVTNKLPVARRFQFILAGFERPGVQIEAFTVDADLDAGATREINGTKRIRPSTKKAQQLVTATFTVLAAHSFPAEIP